MAKTKKTLPADVAERDASLQGDVEAAKGRVDKASMALAEWRWVWTSDTADAGKARVKNGGGAKVSFGIREYARAVKVEHPIVSRYAGAWEDWRNRDESGNPGYHFLDFLNKRRFGEYLWVAAEAVGKLNPPSRTPNKPRTARGVLDDKVLKADADKVSGLDCQGAGRRREHLPG